MPPLDGRRVAILEARMATEMAALVRRLGGIPYQVPAVRETVQPEEAGCFIDSLISGNFSTVVFLTGAGATALLQEASRRHSLEATLAALRLTRIACRGPKPAQVLRQHDVHAMATAAEPFTSRAPALEAVIWRSRRARALRRSQRRDGRCPLARGAVSTRSCYVWRMPDDVEPLRGLVREVIGGHVDVVVFTTQIQCRHLFRVAGDLGLCQQLAQALNSSAVVAAVGPICAEVLRFFGVTPDVVPVRPKLGPMMNALANYYRAAEGGPSSSRPLDVA